jgi:hypothetical protein
MTVPGRTETLRRRIMVKFHPIGTVRSHIAYIEIRFAVALQLLHDKHDRWRYPTQSALECARRGDLGRFGAVISLFLLPLHTTTALLCLRT